VRYPPYLKIAQIVSSNAAESRVKAFDIDPRCSFVASHGWFRNVTCINFLSQRGRSGHCRWTNSFSAFEKRAHLFFPIAVLLLPMPRVSVHSRWPATSRYLTLIYSFPPKTCALASLACFFLRTLSLSPPFCRLASENTLHGARHQAHPAARKLMEATDELLLASRYISRHV